MTSWCAGHLTSDPDGSVTPDVQAKPSTTPVTLYASHPSSSASGSHGLGPRTTDTVKEKLILTLVEMVPIEVSDDLVLYLGSALNTRTVRDLTPRSGLGAGGWSIGIRHRGVLWLNKALGEGRAEVLYSKGGAENAFSCGG